MCAFVFKFPQNATLKFDYFGTKIVCFFSPGAPCVGFCRPVGVEGGEHSPDDVVGEDGRVRLGRAQDQLVHADQEVLLHEHLDRRHVLERREGGTECSA